MRIDANDLFEIYDRKTDKREHGTPWIENFAVRCFSTEQMNTGAITMTRR